MKNSIFLLQFLFLALISCNSQYDEAFLVGNWEKSEWKIIDTGEDITNPLRFKFLSDGRYKVSYGTEMESGNYWISGEYLHTVEDEMAEKKVKIVRLTNDSLIFEMNRGGQLELVKLFKQSRD